MSLAILFSRARNGVDAPLVTVEVHLANGLPGLSIVGLPELAVKESKDRVRGALLNSRFEFPARRITINLAPADLPKDGGRFDLPIAIGILAASGQIPASALPVHEFVGELALSGDLRPVSGVLPLALAVRQAGRHLLLPLENCAEAALVEDLTILPAHHLLQVCSHLRADPPIHRHNRQQRPTEPLCRADLSEVVGQRYAKRALEIAAAGGHSLLMAGPPGSGKSMLASRLPGIMPPMSEEEALESAAVLSVSHRGFHIRDWKQRPFRTPHHTASGAALVGGGGNPMPGEISLAHHGVLFLDELPEFDRRVLEVLREPLETGEITISRAGRQAEFPARFQLVAAMNPCPCGHLGDDTGDGCTCTLEQVRRYRSRLSGPLLDRIDMHIEVPRLRPDLLLAKGAEQEEESIAVRQRVAACRCLQLARSGAPNSQLGGQLLDRYCALQTAEQALLLRAMDTLRLSARAYHRILRVARTIADLDQAEAITVKHLTEAISYRSMDRN